MGTLSRAAPARRGVIVARVARVLGFACARRVVLPRAARAARAWASPTRCARYNAFARRGLTRARPQHDPAAHTVLANRALARCRLGRLGDAVADARQVVALAPTWAKGFARLGACLQAAMRYADAVAAFERAAGLARAHAGAVAAQLVRPRHPRIG